MGQIVSWGKTEESECWGPSPSLSSGKITQWKSQRLLYFQRLSVSLSLVLIKSSGASLTLPKEDSLWLRAQSPWGWVRATGVSLWMSSLRPLAHTGAELHVWNSCIRISWGEAFATVIATALISNHLSPIRPVLLCTNLWPSPVDLLLCPEGRVIFISQKVL